MQVHRQVNISEVSRTVCTKVTSAVIPVRPIVKDKLKVSHPIDILKRPKVTSGSMLTLVCSLA